MKKFNRKPLVKSFYSLGGESLQSLINLLDKEGIEDFSKVELCVDYSDCYYEGDMPTVKAVYAP